jgi:hypothetical protein
MDPICAIMGVLDIIAGLLIYFYAPAWFILSILMIVKGIISFL